MRPTILFPILTLLLATVALAVPHPRDKGPARLPAMGAAAATTEHPLAAAEANYLVTLSRTVSLSAKDTILDVLLRSGAVVKQVYDYRVFQGVLFSVPASTDAGLASWKTTLASLDGVKYIEEDQVVSTSGGH